MKVNINGRLWIETSSGAIAGKGRVTLLERIKKYGSITEAAKSMKMSYRQAWEQIESMNALCKKPLVTKSSGGSGGGGSKLTKEGENLIELYSNLTKDFAKFLKKKNHSI